MEILEDYSQMFGILDKWPKEKFEAEVEIYSKELYAVHGKISKLQFYANALRKNLTWFKKRLDYFYFEDLERNFVLKPEHKLIVHYLEFNKEKGCFLEIVYSHYLYDNFLKLIFGLDEKDLSQNQIDEYNKKFHKLIDEMPFAIKKLAEI